MPSKAKVKRKVARAHPTGLAWAVVGVFCFGYAFAQNGADPDLWHRLAVGGIVEDTGWVLPGDVFSYMPTKASWVDHEWGCGPVFWGLYRVAGGLGLLAAKGILFWLAVLGASRTAGIDLRRAGSGDQAWMLALALALAPAFSTTLRCQSFTMLLLAWWGLWLRRWQVRGATLPWAGFVVTGWLWAQLHGGFLAGYALILAHAAAQGLGALGPRRGPAEASRSLKRAGTLILLLAAVAGAGLLNPYGIQNITAAWNALGHGREGMPEWESVNWQNLSAFPGYALLGAVTAAGYGLALVRMVRRPGRWDWLTIAVVPVALWASWRHVRHIPVFAVVAAPLVYPWIRAWSLAAWRNLAPRWAKLLPKAGYAAVWSAAAVMGAAGLVTAARTPGSLSIGEPYDPVAAVSFLEENRLDGNLLVPFNWGSYALWKRYPYNRVSFDGRFDLIYAPETIRRLTAWEFGLPEGAALLRDYPPDIALTATGSPPESFLAAEGWRRVFQDAHASVWLPPGASPQGPWRLPPQRIPASIDLDDFLARWRLSRSAPSPVRP